MGRLAVLIPTYNGGDLLLGTVASCANAGLDPANYDILVIDNNSDDGALDRLPAKDPAGAAVMVCRNPLNIGRIENWNCALDVARARGYEYGSFLFVGDAWCPGRGIARLLECMERSGAVLGLGRYFIADSDLRPRSLATRFHIVGDISAVSSRAILERAIRNGNLAFGPLQASLFRLTDSHPLRFNPRTPIGTDQEATMTFLRLHTEMVALVAEPIMVWRGHPGRFHMTMKAEDRLREEIRILGSVAQLAGIDVEWPRVHSQLFLQHLYRYVRLGEGSYSVVHACWRFLAAMPGGISWRWLLRYAGARIFSGRNALDFRPRAQGAF